MAQGNEEGIMVSANRMLAVCLIAGMTRNEIDTIIKKRTNIIGTDSDANEMMGRLAEVSEKSNEILQDKLHKRLEEFANLTGLAVSQISVNFLSVSSVLDTKNDENLEALPSVGQRISMFIANSIIAPICRLEDKYNKQDG